MTKRVIHETYRDVTRTIITEEVLYETNRGYL